MGSIKRNFQSFFTTYFELIFSLNIGNTVQIQYIRFYFNRHSKTVSLKNKLFDPYPFLFFTLFLVMASCSENRAKDKKQLYVPMDAGDGREIIIEKFTRGDTPAWLGAMDDIGRLELLLKDLDSISHTRIGYFGELVLVKTTKELFDFFELKSEASNNLGYQFLESENLRLITRKDQGMGMVFKQPEKVTIDGVFIPRYLGF